MSISKISGIRGAPGLSLSKAFRYLSSKEYYRIGMLRNLCYWPLNEASGTRYGYTGSISADFLDVNSNVAQGDGKFGKCAVFTAASSPATILRAPDTIFDVGHDWTVFGWITCTDGTNQYNGIFAKDYNGGTYREMHIDAVFGSSPNGTIQLSTWGIASSDRVDTVSASVVLLDTPAFFICWYDSTTKTQYLQVNGGTIASNVRPTPIVREDAPVVLGQTSPASMKLEALGFSQRILTTTERSILYSSGDGCPLNGWGLLKRGV